MFLTPAAKIGPLLGIGILLAALVACNTVADIAGGKSCKHSRTNEELSVVYDVENTEWKVIRYDGLYFGQELQACAVSGDAVIFQDGYEAEVYLKPLPEAYTLDGLHRGNKAAIRRINHPSVVVTLEEGVWVFEQGLWNPWVWH